ncbi:uncharacterized protein [Clytia hemisphaerica]|uniref:Uncharacterized protein n=1 Tax=Clytia hemisphaerica TaxID=252671 RepID=A0A7M5X896_9CNID
MDGWRTFLVLASLYLGVLSRPYNDGLSQQYQSYLRTQYPQYYAYQAQQQYLAQQANEEQKAHQVESNPAPNIVAQMTDLEHDVSGFHDAMAGMAEAMIVTKQNKDGSLTVEEKLEDAENGKKKSSVNKHKKKAAKKLASERRRFEKEMVKFFTNFMCGKEC